jgi:hypothetical protein
MDKLNEQGGDAQQIATHMDRIKPDVFK